MHKQADVSKYPSGKLWAIGHKGLEICVFRFDVGNCPDQNPDCYTHFEPLNLGGLNTVQLDELNVKYIECDNGNFGRIIAFIKWRLDNDNRALGGFASQPTLY